MQTSSPYLGYFPVGAFVVRLSPPAASAPDAPLPSVTVLLAPFLTTLKTMGRLKGFGTCSAVTPLNTECIAFVRDGGEVAGWGNAGPLSKISIAVNEAHPAVVCPTTAPPLRNPMAVFRTVSALASNVGELSGLLGRSGADVPPTTSLVAVHVTGHWSEEEIAGVLTASEASHADQSNSYAVLGYVHQLRALSRACGWGLPSVLPATCAPNVKSGCSTAVVSRKDMSAINASEEMRRRATVSKVMGPHPTDLACVAGGGAAQGGAFTFSELFGGIGMFRLGLEAAGGTAAFAVECSIPARVAHEANFGGRDAAKGSASKRDREVASDLGGVNGGKAISNRQLRKLQKEAQKLRGETTGARSDQGAVNRVEAVCVEGKETSPAEKPPLPALKASSPLAFDLTEIPTSCFPPHDFLTAGFPCQSFAKAGPQEGLNNAKGWLFYEVIRALLGSRPRVFLLENVANLVDVEEGVQLEEIMRCLRCPSATAVAGMEGVRCGPSDEASLSYTVAWRVVDGAVVTPQTRRRVYFIGIRSDLTSPSALEGAVTETFIQTIFDAAERNLSGLAKEQAYKTVRDLLISSPSPHDQRLSPDATWGGVVLTPSQWDAVQRSRTFRRDPARRICNIDGLSRTVMGSYRSGYQLFAELIPHPLPTKVDGEPFSPEAFIKRYLDADIGTHSESAAALPPSATDVAPPPVRFLSVREAARLQGIPDTFTFPQLEQRVGAGGEEGSQAPSERLSAVYKLVGNAVNPLVIRGIASAIAASGVL